MAHITALPEGLSYFPDSEKRPDGKPKMVLDISKAVYVEMVPERLKGVDRIMALNGQLRYVAPDYQGDIVVFDRSINAAGFVVPVNRRVLSELEKGRMQNKYKQRKSLSAGIFEHSHKATEMCAAYPAEEMNLPAGLSFSWNPKTLLGTLAATKTWLTTRPVIKNVSNVFMPSAERLKWKAAAESELLRRRHENVDRVNYGQICQMTGEWRFSR